MKRHAINIGELYAWKGDHWTQYAASVDADIKSNKVFECNLDGLYRVVSHGRVLYTGGVAGSAVKEYNAAP